MKNVYHVYSQDLLPRAHVEYLETLSSDMNVKPKVIYDIGSCVQHWYRHAKRIWPEADIYCFDAFEYLKPLYDETKVNFNNVLLYDVDYAKIKFYKNDFYYGGNSIYKEETSFFPSTGFVMRETITLDTLVQLKSIPYPDLIKMDIQSAELDCLRGASKCLEHATHLIIEIVKDEINYNRGGPKKEEIIDYLKNIDWYILHPAFSSNPCDADYSFVNIKKIRRTNY
jgi:FkbM family methyltransferase